MKPISVLPLLFIYCVFSGCSFFLKKMYGVKNPEVESKESIMKYARSVGLDTALIVTVDTSFFLTAFKRVHNTIPEAELFSKEGRNLSYKNESTDCNAGLFAFIPNLKKDTVYAQKDSFRLDEQLKNLRDLNGNTLTLEENNSADYYLFIYWTRWIGKLNKDHVRKWETLAASNKNVNIKVFEVNMDFQSWWSERFTRKITSLFSGTNK